MTDICFMCPLYVIIPIFAICIIYLTVKYLITGKDASQDGGEQE